MQRSYLLKECLNFFHINANAIQCLWHFKIMVIIEIAINIEGVLVISNLSPQNPIPHTYSSLCFLHGYTILHHWGILNAICILCIRYILCGRIVSCMLSWTCYGLWRAFQIRVTQSRKISSLKGVYIVELHMDHQIQKI